MERLDRTLFIKVAVNGARSPAEHPTLPVSPEAIAQEAQGAVAAGAAAVHFHVRDTQGRESLAPAEVERCRRAVRATVPGTPLGVSTGAWIVPNLSQRLRLIEGWPTLPDFASVNFHEAGAEEVAELLYRRGVGVELGLSNPAAAGRALAAGWGERCVRILLEPEEAGVTAALATVAAIERLLDEVGTAAPRLLHGSEATAWPLLAEAARRGYQCRIGLEDTLSLPTGELAADNAQLVRAAVEVIGDGG